MFIIGVFDSLNEFCFIYLLNDFNTVHCQSPISRLSSKMSVCLTDNGGKFILTFFKSSWKVAAQVRRARLASVVSLAIGHVAARFSFNLASKNAGKTKINFLALLKKTISTE